MSATPPADRASRSPRRGLPLALRVAVFALLTAIALVAGLLVSGQGAALTTLLSPAPIPTATATSPLPAFHATETAQAALLTTTYAPVGIGPCDTTDPPYTRENASYWQWNQPGPITCGVGGVTQLTGETDIGFYGFPTGFPPSFVATLTLSFHPSAARSCLTYEVNGPSSSVGLILCDDGQWQSTRYTYVTGYTAKADHYTIVMRVTPNGAQFTLNGEQVTGEYPHGAITDINISTDTTITPGALINLERFTLDPRA